jgi:hypothetical protein
MRAAAFAPALALALFGAGCGDLPQAANDLHVADLALPPICTAGELGDAGVPATWKNVEQIMDQKCATGVCHFTGFHVVGGLGVDLSHGHAYADLVNQTAIDTPNSCGGPLVKPFDPARSYLMVKLTVPKGMQCDPQGEQMPVTDGLFQPLDDCELDLVRRWIAAGAPPL